jgi:L-lactate dehydrogenase complex protein LldG
MTEAEERILELFKKKAAAVSAKVVEVKDLQEAMSYALDVCARKDFCELVYVGEGEKGGRYGRATQKMFAAPGLSERQFGDLEKAGREKGFTVIREGMRGYVSGIDVGFSIADLGIADTGCCVLASGSEDARLAGMVSEIHVVALAKSKIVHSLDDAENFMNGLMDKGAMFIAFISGPSRTADIERVLTIGVHGPLELHVALMES